MNYYENEFNDSSNDDNVLKVPLPSSQDADMYKKPWYAGACDRRTADDVLFRSNKVRIIWICWIISHDSPHPTAGFDCERSLFQDGAFMVRKSSGQDAQQPYTLVVFYKGRVYNIPIRLTTNSQQYALGREKRGEEVQRRTFLTENCFKVH